MRDHIVTGKDGEALAADFLQQQGYVIHARNWRHRRAEVDIIASRENILHFIEVKTRKSVAFGFPEEGVSFKKIKMVMTAAAAWCFENPGWLIVQYDVIAVLMIEGMQVEMVMIEDVSV